MRSYDTDYLVCGLHGASHKLVDYALHVVIWYACSDIGEKKKSAEGRRE